MITFYTFILVTGSVGNGFVIKSFLAEPDQPGSRFVVILATVDFISSILIPFVQISVLLFNSILWPLGEISCYILTPIPDSVVYASAWFLVAISLERAR